jgi:hypothetical protein
MPWQHAAPGEPPPSLGERFTSVVIPVGVEARRVRSPSLVEVSVEQDAPRIVCTDSAILVKSDICTARDGCRIICEHRADGEDWTSLSLRARLRRPRLRLRSLRRRRRAAISAAWATCRTD